jgi:hypothetical protein
MFSGDVCSFGLTWGEFAIQASGGAWFIDGYAAKRIDGMDIDDIHIIGSGCIMVWDGGICILIKGLDRWGGFDGLEGGGWWDGASTTKAHEIFASLRLRFTAHFTIHHSNQSFYERTYFSAYPQQRRFKDGFPGLFNIALLGCMQLGWRRTQYPRWAKNGWFWYRLLRSLIDMSRGFWKERHALDMGVEHCSSNWMYIWEIGMEGTGLRMCRFF